MVLTRRVIADGFLAMIMLVLASSTFGVFALPVAEDFGVPSVGLAFGLFSLMHGISAPIAGVFVDRLGPVPIRRFGAMALTVGFLLAATAGHLVQFYIGLGVLTGLGSAAFSGPALSVQVATAAGGRKLLPIFGIVMAGAGLGSVVVIPLSEAGVRIWDWHGVYLIYAMAAGGVWLISEWNARSGNRGRSPKSPQRQRHSTSDHTRPRRLPEWAEGRLILANASSGAQRTLIVASLIPWAVMHGVPSATAAGAFALAEGLRACSGIVITRLGSRMGARLIYAGSSIGAGVGIALAALLTPRFGIWSLYAGMALYGVTSGGIHPSSISYESEVFRAEARGTLLGVSTAAFGFGGASAVAGTRLLGVDRAALDITMWVIVAALVIVGILVLTVQPRSPSSLAA